MSWQSRFIGPTSLKSPLKMFAAVNTGETHGISSSGQAKVLQGEIRLKEQRQEKADRELEKNAEERKKKRVDQTPSRKLGPREPPGIESAR